MTERTTYTVDTKGCFAGCLTTMLLAIVLAVIFALVMFYAVKAAA